MDVRPFWASLEEQARDSMILSERAEATCITGPAGTGDGSSGAQCEGVTKPRVALDRIPGTSGAGDGDYNSVCILKYNIINVHVQS